MPLTAFQQSIAQVLAKNRTPDSHLDVVALKRRWIAALDQAESFIERMPANEVGCLYYSLSDKKFVAPTTHDGVLAHDIVRHFGKLGGILPQLYDGDVLGGVPEVLPS